MSLQILLRFGRKNRLEGLVVSFPNPLLMRPQRNLHTAHSTAQVEIFRKSHFSGLMTGSKKCSIIQLLSTLIRDDPNPSIPQILYGIDEMQHGASMKRNVSVACNSSRIQVHQLSRETSCLKCLYIFTKKKRRRLSARLA